MAREHAVGSWVRAQRNHANFADPPVTLVALLLHGIFAGSLSSLFYFVPLRKIFFAAANL